MYFLIFIVTLGGIILTLYMLKEAFSNNLIEHELYFDSLPEEYSGTEFIFISDIHRRLVSDKIIEKISKQVQYIVIGGDLVERFVPLRRVENNLRKLSEVAQVYFVWGNNDYEIAEEKLEALFKKYGVISLNNDAVSFQAGYNKNVALIGIKDPQLKVDFNDENDWQTVTQDRIERSLNKAKGADFKILAVHKPNIAYKITEEDDVQLILCGHTHGGQIHILGYSPYEKGTIYSKGKMKILISNGYGTTCLPLRLGAKSELHLIRLLKG